MSKEFRILFVCMGNICRSPTAHAVFRRMVRDAGLADRVTVDSAGTHGWHVGGPPDPRSVEHALRRGYDLADLRSRQVIAADFERADLVLVMDDDNLSWLEARCPAAHRAKLRRLTDFCTRHAHRGVVPDPYDGDAAAFEHVVDLVEDAWEGLLAQVAAAVKTPR